MQHTEKTDISSEAVTVGRQLDKSFLYSSKHEPIKGTLVSQRKLIEFVRNREDHVKVPYGQEFFETVVYPLHSC
jgi:hypothetical protein